MVHHSHDHPNRRHRSPSAAASRHLRPPTHEQHNPLVPRPRGLRAIASREVLQQHPNDSPYATGDQARRDMAAAAAEREAKRRKEEEEEQKRRHRSDANWQASWDAQLKAARQRVEADTRGRQVVRAAPGNSTQTYFNPTDTDGIAIAPLGLSTDVSAGRRGSRSSPRRKNTKEVTVTHKVE
ncbi:hypothetical protein JCM10207_004127 [Rhodosporidiobolus poonsookiae]